LKVVKCGRLIDGTGAPAIKDAVIVIEGSKIVDVGKESRIDVPEGPDVEEIDCTDKTVLPGLIDAHVHLALGAGRNYEEMFSHSDHHLLIAGVVNARSILDFGVTTVRDMGTRNRVAFELREASDMGLIQTPRLLLSGRAITMTGGHFHYCNAVADGYEGVRRMARFLLAEGADFIKIMASGGGTPNTDPRRASYSVEELRGACDAAHTVGKTVAAHCQATEAIINAVEAGVDFIEHCRFLEPSGHNFREDVARDIAKAGIVVSHAITVLPDPRLLEIGFENFRGLRRAGVEIIAATDDLFLDQIGRLPLELELMVRGGMTPMEAIQSATSRPAKAMGIEQITGTLEKGKEADLIAVNGDPLKDIRTLASPAMVMKGGEIIPPSPRRVARENVTNLIRKVREIIDERGLGR